jgi:hypothetical protein
MAHQVDNKFNEYTDWDSPNVKSVFELVEKDEDD